MIQGELRNFEDQIFTELMNEERELGDESKQLEVTEQVLNDKVLSK